MYPAADPLHPTTSVESDSPIISMAQTCVLALIILIPLIGLVIEPVEAEIRPRQAHVSLLLHFQLSFIYHPVTLRPCVSRRKHILRNLTPSQTYIKSCRHTLTLLSGKKSQLSAAAVQGLQHSGP